MIYQIHDIFCVCVEKFHVILMVNVLICATIAQVWFKSNKITDLFFRINGYFTLVTVFIYALFYIISTLYFQDKFYFLHSDIFIFELLMYMLFPAVLLEWFRQIFHMMILEYHIRTGHVYRKLDYFKWYRGYYAVLMTHYAFIWHNNQYWFRIFIKPHRLFCYLFEYFKYIKYIVSQWF